MFVWGLVQRPVAHVSCRFQRDADGAERIHERTDGNPLFVEELAVHPRMQGRGVGGFMIDQLQHLARLRGCTHLVLEVAENNRDALAGYAGRHGQRGGLPGFLFFPGEVTVHRFRWFLSIFCVAATTSTSVSRPKSISLPSRP